MKGRLDKLYGKLMSAPKAKPEAIEWAYHGTKKRSLKKIAKDGLIPRGQPSCHRDEKRCTDEPVIFFGLRRDDAATWGDVILRFPVPEDYYEDAYGDTVISKGGELIRSAYYTLSGVPPEQIEVESGGRWLPLLENIGKRKTAAKKQKKPEPLTCPECGGGLTLEDPSYGLVCPACSVRVTGPFKSASEVPDYVSYYDKRGTR